MKEYFKLFEEVSEWHWQLNVLPVWEKYENGRLPWQSVAIFLSTYAYETGGGVNPNYAPVAEDTIQENSDVFDKEIKHNRELEDRIWQVFTGKIDGYGGLKHKGNSLSPCASEDFEKRHEGNGKSLIARMQRENIVNLIEYVRTCLHDDKAKEAFKFLDSIRGVGDKIASFFLRDVREISGNRNRTLTDRELLQPIDSWIRNTVRQKLAPDRIFPNDIEVAKWIVDGARKADCNPERINMGMWYFGANVCGRGRYKFNKIFRSFESAKKAWGEYCERLRRI